VIGELDPRLAELRDAYTRASEQLRSADRDANTRKVVEQMESEVATLEERSRKLTEALGRLDALKLGPLQKLPIPGLEVRDGDIYRDGVPFDRLNRAQQVQIAIDVARLRAGRLGLVCVDGLECLDRETFEAFCEQAAASDLQLIVSRVTEGELEVRTVEPAAAAQEA